MSPSSEGFAQATESLDLARFLPYRLSVIANLVSRQLATLCAERFGIGIAEWRVIAVLGQHDDVTADFVCGRTAMDRVTISRAVTRLREKRYIRRRAAPSDRRCSMLSLSAAGRRIYERLVPLARRYERALTAGLSAGQRADLERTLDALAAAVETISTDFA